MAAKTKFWLSSRISMEELRTPGMLSDSIILKKIQRQPKQTAGYKTLLRELGQRRSVHDLAVAKPDVRLFVHRRAEGAGRA